MINTNIIITSGDNEESELFFDARSENNYVYVYVTDVNRLFYIDMNGLFLCHHVVVGGIDADNNSLRIIIDGVDMI